MFLWLERQEMIIIVSIDLSHFFSRQSISWLKLSTGASGGDTKYKLKANINTSHTQQSKKHIKMQIKTLTWLNNATLLKTGGIWIIWNIWTGA